MCVLKWNKRGSFQKTTIYYSMLFNLCAYWNETRGTVFKKKKKHQFITVCYSTCVHIEMKQEGQFSKKSNWWQYATELVCEMKQEGQFSKKTIYYSMLSTCVRIEMKQEGQFSKNNNLLQYVLVCVLKWNKRGSFQKTTIYYSMLFNLLRIEMKQEGQFSKKNNNLLQYAIQLVCVLKWNKRGSFQKNPIDDNMLLNSCAKWNKRGSFQKTTIYYSMLFNLCAYWNETRGTVFKKKKNPIYDNMLLNLCAKWNKRGSFQKTTIYYSMLFNLCAYWNETRGTVFNKKKTIYYSMLFNLCAYWNETRGAVFKKKKKHQFITVCYSTCVRIEMKQEGQFSKNNWWQYAQKTTIYYSMLFNLCAYWNETRGTVFKKQQFITVCYSTCVHIEMKQEGQFSKKSNLWHMLCSFQKTTIYYSMLFNLCAYWNETRGAVFKKQQFITVCYSTCVRIEMKQEGQFSKKNPNYSMTISLQFNCMIFNLCAYWNETRGAVFKKQQFIIVSYSTCVRIEMKQEGQFSKNNNLLQYAIQLVCILKWNKRDSFQKNPINDNMLLNLCAKWNKRGSFQKTTIYYSMLFNLCAYWNETRTVFKKNNNLLQYAIQHIEMKQEGQFSKKKHQFITVCYSTCVHIEMKQEGTVFKKIQNDNLLQYAIQLVCVLKWNKRGSFQKTTIYYSMLFNLCAYWNETRGTVFKKIQLIY